MADVPCGQPNLDQCGEQQGGKKNQRKCLHNK
jgi:hypothetical protein